MLALLVNGRMGSNGLALEPPAPSRLQNGKKRFVLSEIQSATAGISLLSEATTARYIFSHADKTDVVLYIFQRSCMRASQACAG
jgi:hypothetical protein